MYLQSEAKFWRRRQLCAHVCQTSVPKIAGSSLNQDSIQGTDQSLYAPSGRPKCSSTQISSRSEAIRILLGPYFGKFHDFLPFFGYFLQKYQPLRSLATLEKLRQLSWHHNKDYSSFQVPNATCDAVTHAQQNRNSEKPRFPTVPIWEF